MARTVNHYFNHVPGAKGEQRLVEDIIVEAIRINGMKIYYIPRTLVKFDPVFGEDPLSKFEKYFTIEMYFDNPSEGFGGERHIISKLGLDMRDTANFIVSRRRFNQVVKSDGYTSVPNPQYELQEAVPKPGDLIYIPVTKDLFQITFAEHESVFYQMAYRFIWRVDVQKYGYSSEKFTTGVPEIDRVEDLFENLDSLDKDPLSDNETLLDRAVTNINVTEKNVFGDPI